MAPRARLRSVSRPSAPRAAPAVSPSVRSNNKGWGMYVLVVLVIAAISALAVVPPGTIEQVFESLKQAAPSLFGSTGSSSMHGRGLKPGRELLGLLTLDVSAHPDEFAGFLEEAGQPALITGSTAQRDWKATKWTIQGLSEQFGAIDGWYRNTEKTFGPYYDETRPFADIAQPTKDYEKEVTLDPITVLGDADEHADHSPSTSGTTSNASRSYVYLSRELYRIDSSLEEDLEPARELLSLYPKRSSVNLWIGEKGVRAHAHFDGYHNFYVQVQGKKTFYIFPPSTVSELGVYPFLHPQHAQAQANLTDPLIFSSLKPIVAELLPGSMLYLPPLWWHYVVAETASLSVNVWTDSRQTNLASSLAQSTFSIVQAIHEIEAKDDRQDVGPDEKAASDTAQGSSSRKERLMDAWALACSAVVTVFETCDVFLRHDSACSDISAHEGAGRSGADAHYCPFSALRSASQSETDTCVPPTQDMELECHYKQMQSILADRYSNNSMAAFQERPRSMATRIASLLDPQEMRERCLDTARAVIKHAGPTQRDLRLGNSAAASADHGEKQRNNRPVLSYPRFRKGYGNVCRAIEALPEATRILWLGNWVETVFATSPASKANQLALLRFAALNK